MTAELTPAEVDCRMDALADAASYHHYRPLADAAIDSSPRPRPTAGSTPGSHRSTSRCVASPPGTCACVVGYSHSGKTLVALHIIRHNHDKRVAYFVPDEPAPLVLTKLACMSSGCRVPSWRNGSLTVTPWGMRVLQRDHRRVRQPGRVRPAADPAGDGPGVRRGLRPLG